MSRPIRFLEVTTFYPPYSFGGDALYVYQLSHALARRGHQVDVVHCVDSYRVFVRTEPPMRLPEHPNVSVHALRSPFGRLSPLLTHQTGWPLLKYGALKRILARPFDVIHFHNVSLFGPKVLTIADKHDSVLKVYTAHEHWLVCPMHVLWKNNREPCDRPTCMSCTIAAGRPPQLWRYTSLLSRAAGSVDLFLAPSRFAAGMHAERGFTRPMSHLAPFAVRRDDDWRSPGARPHDRPYFLFVGRLEPVKGIETLIRAWDSVLDTDLLIVGEGSQRPLIEAAAARNPRIVVCGPVPQDQLGPYFVHSIGCLVPSITYEVAPMVVVEAFARKTPVVARDLGGTPECVRDSGGGLLFRTDDELLEALRRLASDARFRADLGERGYRQFVDLWTEDAHLTAFLGMLDDVARRKFGRVLWDVDAVGGGAERAPEPRFAQL